MPCRAPLSPRERFSPCKPSLGLAAGKVHTADTAPAHKTYLLRWGFLAEGQEMADFKKENVNETFAEIPPALISWQFEPPSIAYKKGW